MFKSVKLLEGFHITATEKRNFLYVLNQNKPEYLNQKITVNRMVFLIEPLGNNEYKLTKFEKYFSFLQNRYTVKEWKYKLKVKEG
ncbi:MAG TPA: hypothetical protein VMV36_01570 [Ignavibacteriaceae bacterium]|nr:hypothetical protein [Ignavibacteriaceae bacterium]